jgi:hypothetical protein
MHNRDRRRADHHHRSPQPACFRLRFRPELIRGGDGTEEHLRSRFAQVWFDSLTTIDLDYSSFHVPLFRGFCYALKHGIGSTIVSVPNRMLGCGIYRRCCPCRPLHSEKSQATKPIVTRKTAYGHRVYEHCGDLLDHQFTAGFGSLASRTIFVDLFSLYQNCSPKSSSRFDRFLYMCRYNSDGRPTTSQK